MIVPSFTLLVNLFNQSFNSSQPDKLLLNGFFLQKDVFIFMYKNNMQCSHLYFQPNIHQQCIRDLILVVLLRAVSSINFEACLLRTRKSNKDWGKLTENNWQMRQCTSLISIGDPSFECTLGGHLSWKRNYRNGYDERSILAAPFVLAYENGNWFHLSVFIVTLAIPGLMLLLFTLHAESISSNFVSLHFFDCTIIPAKLFANNSIL